MRIKLIQVEGKKNVNEYKKITLIVVKIDMSIKKITKSVTSKRIKWNKKIHMINFD